ncbi:family 53 glycosyl hydrolase [Massariosphaeria phaeospora]|uniref:Arabinogalactan endo-beta-1,4-galactanase n=1 Tax=Massariosphaeria phaeospora TaxID=100035 RepID=A0A7C8MS97_9PLEO|nr:family 53 glycosyl hydrolase [Massariosphaeria phaeospora]
MRLFAILALLAPLARSALPHKGVDWSSLLLLEAHGQTYKTPAGQTQPLENILRASGVTMVRQRIWVNPTADNGAYNLDYNLRLARRAHAAGLAVYLDFHYSDTWADPGKQGTPAAWAALGRDALVAQLGAYTKSVMDAFQNEGLPLALVSIGNEITPGLLFPTGELARADGPRNVAALLHAAATAIRTSAMAPQPKIMIHLDNGWKWDTQQWWYDRVLGSGGGLAAADFDVQGVSYYPFYNAGASLAALSASMANMARKYGKEVMVVETNWPSWCPNPKYAFPSDVKAIPVSVEGQTKWVREVARRVAEVPGGKGTGLFYWEPAWIGNAGLGSSCGWNLMVGEDGKAMESLAVFGSI